MPHDITAEQELVKRLDAVTRHARRLYYSILDLEELRPDLQYAGRGGKIHRLRPGTPGEKCAR